MIVLAVAGGVCVVVAVVFALLGVRARRRGQTIAETPTTRCADVGDLVASAANGADQRVECAGRAAPGPGGPVSAPFSTRACVWYRSTITEHYWDTEHRRDSDGRTRTERVRRQREVSDDRAEAPFALTDDSGTVLVDPRKARMDQPERVLNEFHDRPREGFLKELISGDRTIGYEHEEWIIAADTPLYVNGGAVARGDGWALAIPAGGGELLVSTRSEQELLAATQRAARWWFAGAGVLGVVGLGLLVAALAV